MLNQRLLAVDRGEFGFPAEIDLMDISESALARSLTARSESILEMPAFPDTRDVILQKPDGSFSANLATNNSASQLYITDAGNGQIKRFSVSDFVNAFDEMETLDWDLDGTDFGAPFEFPLGGVAGFNSSGHAILTGFGSIEVVNVVTFEVLEELDPAGTGPFYTIIHNRPLRDLIAIDGSIPSVIYATKNGLIPSRACDFEDEVRDQYDLLVADFMLGDDIDGDLVPDAGMLEFVILASCQPSEDFFAAATMLAYESNLGTIEDEAAIMALEPYKYVLAALMLMSQDMQDAVRAIPGIALADAYTIVTGADEDNFLPAFGTGLGTYMPDPMLVFEESFIGTGDPDFDKFTNTEEYDNITAIGGDIIDFAISAFDRALNGNGVTTGSGGGCFIATAAFGTPMAPEINRLRIFRDRHLLTTSLGTAFTDAYYHVSPPVADYIAKRPVLRAGVRGGIYVGLWTLDYPLAVSCLFLLMMGTYIYRSKRFRPKAFRGSGSA